jgi:para-aminobenzoate synthetase
VTETGARLTATFVELAATYDRMFWLDGGGSRAWSGRRSILGWLERDDVSLTYDAGTRQVLRHQHGRAEVVGDDPFAVLTEEVVRDAGDGSVSWVGYFGYASRSDLPATVAGPAFAAPAVTGPAVIGRPPSRAVPDAVWMRVRSPMFVDHDPGRGLPGGLRRPPAPTTRYLRSGVPAGYATAFAAVQQELRLGNSYEVNLTYREAMVSPVDPVAAYLRLRAASPAPYAGFLQHHGMQLLSSSPERFATVDRDGCLETKPIKGTTSRGSSPAEDAAQLEALATDGKYRAENLMIVDLLRNDLSMVCEPGTVDVPVLMEVESYASVHQLVSTVRGRLRPGVGTVEALRALFPAGSMTGAPKLRTMHIIEAVEASPRGVYAGAFGWIGADGRADLGVVIRSLVATPVRTATGFRWRYELGTGGGITVRSDVAEEYAETRWKAERLRAAVTPVSS